ncbi:MAG: HlyD family efflux transporter periplasmic adaptor subunit [Planctomycetaceae bacterium]|nr:HlyD family efflux transporter periplasmic adaptor subunit [Planctomycetaceae bacterium]
MSAIPPPPVEALDLVLLAGNARSPNEFAFTVLNRSVAIVRYDRATLWRLGPHPAPQAVSGPDPLGERSPFAASWTALVEAMRSQTTGGLLNRDAFNPPTIWDDKWDETAGLSALWLPLPERNAAFLFERWGEDEFTHSEAAALIDLVEAYNMVWPGARKRPLKRIKRGLVPLAVAAAILALLLIVRLPLRVVAPCEVTARTPHLVAAPMDGVIDEVVVRPGQRVEAGDELARYDSRMMEEDLNVTRRQVEVVEAELSAARARGFSDPRYRGDIALLEARLEAETARLEALEARYARRTVTAARPGLVQLDDARAWRGRPVATGQAILYLVDPDDSRLTIWLPQDDRIDIDPDRLVRVHLHALGGAAREARLTYVSSFAQPTPDGIYAFQAEAEWEGDLPPPPLGLRGSASLYGDNASLGYWLFRRPMAWLRRWVGL